MHGGFHVHVFALGEHTNPPVLLLHGHDHDASLWKTLGTLERLSVMGCRAMALNLPGFGESDDIRISPNVLLAEILPALQIERPVVVAPSLSGRYALPLVHRNPGMVSGLVAVAPVNSAEYVPRLGCLKLRTLVVWGEKDARYPVSLGEALAGAIDGARMVVLPDARHACYMDSPDLFHRHLLDFVAGIYGLRPTG
jgi:abhydrolase domain-containing protein 14